MKILFLHGFGSQPGGIKPAFLRGHGHEVINPALPDRDFEESVRIAQQAFDKGPPDVIVGSSRGGAVALNMDSGRVPLVLLAPAWRKWRTATVDKRAITILHSENDDVVPIASSREFIEVSGLPEENLVVVGEDHRMIDEAAFAALIRAVEGD